MSDYAHAMLPTRTSRRLAAWGLASSLVLVLVPIASAQPAPAAFERTVVMDTPSDFQANGAADIGGVFAYERFAYDFDRGIAQGNRLVVRLAMADMSQFSAGTTFRYYVGFEHDGKARSFWTQIVQGAQSPSPEVNANSPGAEGSLTGNDVSLSLSLQSNGFKVGSSFSGLWAATAIPSEGSGPIYQDTVPRNNQNAPSGSTPGPESNVPLVVLPPYAFARLEPVGSLEQRSALGDDVRYNFKMIGGAGAKAEIVKVFFTPPDGWNAEPSRGDGGIGSVANLNAGTSIDFAVTLSSLAGAAEGDNLTTGVELVSSSGAHQTLNLTTIVTHPRFSTDAFNVVMLSPASFDGPGRVQLEFDITGSNGTALNASLPVGLDVRYKGDLVAIEKLVRSEAGTFTFEYDFQASGAWTVDVYIAGVNPAPHATFDVSVEESGIPGLGAPMAMLAALGAAGLIRRRRG